MSDENALGKRMDSYELAGKGRKSEEGESEVQGEVEKDKPEPLAADSRKDTAEHGAQYRRRSAREHQQYSPSWKSVD